MGSVGISFGSATSGAGFDVATTVASILAVQRTPETAWATQTTALTTQDAVLSTLGTDASALSTALSSLTAFDGVFSSKTGGTSDTSTVELTNVESSAAVGSHTLTVSQLAQTSQHVSTAVASSATVSGTIGVQVGSGTATTLNIASGSTVAQVAAQINSAAIGVTASVITDSGGSRLSVVSNTSGSAGEVTLSGSLTDSSGNGITYAEPTAGQDAEYTLDGASLTSSSNTVSSALTGVTFQLLNNTTGNGSNGSVTLQVAADTSSISTALSTFVTAYNTLTTALTAQEGKDSSGNAEPLFGSTIVQQLQSGLSAALSFSSSTVSGAANTTALTPYSLGLTVNTDGTLSLDTGTLSTTLTNRLNDVTDYFQNAGNFGQNFVTTLNNLGSTGMGALALAVQGNSSQETTLANDKTALEARLTTYSATLTTELNTANEVLQAIPQQLSGITALFNSINGTNSSNG